MIQYTNGSHTTTTHHIVCVSAWLLDDLNRLALDAVSVGCNLLAVKEVRAYIAIICRLYQHDIKIPYIEKNVLFRRDNTPLARYAHITEPEEIDDSYPHRLNTLVDQVKLQAFTYPNEKSFLNKKLYKKPSLSLKPWKNLNELGEECLKERSDYAEGLLKAEFIYDEGGFLCTDSEGIEYAEWCLREILTLYLPLMLQLLREELIVAVVKNAGSEKPVKPECHDSLYKFATKLATAFELTSIKCCAFKNNSVWMMVRPSVKGVDSGDGLQLSTNLLTKNAQPKTIIKTVAFYVPTFVGGAENALKEVIKQLNEEGCSLSKGIIVIEVPKKLSEVLLNVTEDNAKSVALGLLTFSRPFELAKSFAEITDIFVNEVRVYKSEVAVTKYDQLVTALNLVKAGIIVMAAFAGIVGIATMGLVSAAVFIATTTIMMAIDTSIAALKSISQEVKLKKQKKENKKTKRNYKWGKYNGPVVKSGDTNSQLLPQIFDKRLYKKNSGGGSQKQSHKDSVVPGERKAKIKYDQKIKEADFLSHLNSYKH